MKTIGFSMVLANFQKIDVFEKSMQKLQFWLHFGMPKPLKIHQKSCLKFMLVFNTAFSAFFSVFLRFWLDLGRPREVQKLEKSLKKRFRCVFQARLDFRYDFGSDFRTILPDFWWIWDGFWRYLGRI